MHPGQVQDQAAVDGVRAAGQPGTGAAYDDGDTEVGADTDGVLHVGLDAGTQGNDWQPHGRPLGLVVGQAREDRGVDHEVLLRDPSAECLEQPGPPRVLGEHGGSADQAGGQGQ